MFESLEKRFYPREELAKIAGLDPKDHNFSATMKNKLELWCYEYEFKSRKGYNITKVPETPEERLMEILRRDVRIDTQIDILDFSCFMSACVIVPDFLAMPWRTRELMVQSYFDLRITDRTMMSWRDKLIESEYIFNAHNIRTLWHTVMRDGQKVQEKADPESPEYKEYCDLRSGILAGYEAMGIHARSVWGNMVHQLYDEYGVYYYCKSIEFNGFKLKDLEIIRELTEEILRTKTD